MEAEGTPSCQTPRLLKALDVSYTAPAAEKNRFDAVNNFLFVVLDHCIKYPSARTILAKHKASTDGQAALKELEADARLEYITVEYLRELDEKHRNLTANPDVWKKGLSLFLEKWLKDTQTLEEANGSPLTTKEKKARLSSSLMAHPAGKESLLTADLVKEQAKLLASASGTAYVEPPFEHYLTTLKQAFHKHDQSEALTTGGTKAKSPRKIKTGDHKNKPKNKHKHATKDGDVPYLKKLEILNLLVDPADYGV